MGGRHGLDSTIKIKPQRREGREEVRGTTKAPDAEASTRVDKRKSNLNELVIVFELKRPPKQFDPLNNVVAEIHSGINIIFAAGLASLFSNSGRSNQSADILSLPVTAPAKFVADSILVLATVSVLELNSPLVAVVAEWARRSGLYSIKSAHF
ncbi:MAG: hypothetical protein L0387_21210 [Acidobacteria bacterium]|nr:hypothetical protein [Acidobacteriota bacterium]MCI0624135.1 hypothetical protein [Acidobacteriota bacterium]MCI0717968.1 hypothetical protein [Acidobacteriota bacterium]